MSALEPPVSGMASDNAARHHAVDSGISSGQTSFLRPGKRRWKRALGLFLLAITVVLWTASNFLASTIFADDTYSKPYFVTYINTAFFIIPLIPVILRRAYRNRREIRKWARDWRQQNVRYSALLPKSTESLVASLYADNPRSTTRRRASANTPEELLLDNSGLLEDVDDGDKVAVVGDVASSSLAPLNLREIAGLALEFCLLWFIANYFTSACLGYTTVASSTILTSTSSIFTLLFGSLLGVELFTLRKLLAVLASLAGIILISGTDFSGSTTDDEHRGDFPEKSLRQLAIGDTLALLSAIMYGLYVSLMKRRVGDESRVSLPIFFGFVGLINVALLWPGFFILHFAGWERFELPPTKRILLIVVCNSLASLISDLAWAYAILLTSPIVVTVGLSMTIPLSLIGQIFLNHQTAGVVYWIGAVVVVLSFIFINHEEKHDEQKMESEAAGQLGRSSVTLDRDLPDR